MRLLDWSKPLTPKPYLQAKLCSIPHTYSWVKVAEPTQLNVGAMQGSNGQYLAFRDVTAVMENQMKKKIENSLGSEFLQLLVQGM